MQLQRLLKKNHMKPKKNLEFWNFGKPQLFYRKFVEVGLAQKPIKKPPKLSEDSGKKWSERQPQNKQRKLLMSLRLIR